MLLAAASKRARGAARRLLSSSAAAPFRAVAGARRTPPPIDEGDWSYHREWWGEEDGPGDGAQTVFRRHSECGNGVVSVVSYPASRPASEQWPAVEKWLQERNATLFPDSAGFYKFKILDYQWRVMRFNDHTRQSTAKVMTCYRTGLESLYLMQQPHCLAVPYVKSMVSAGLTALASSSYDLASAASGHNTMKVLCIGHGGGTLPLFLASKFKGANIHIVEIDPVVVSASVESMGFPASSVKGPLLCESMQPPDAHGLLWSGVYNRIFLHIADAEDFIVDDSSQYDIVFIDAYDGEDVFPHKLWDADGKFMKSLEKRVHPVHGTVVVNLHSDSAASGAESDDRFQQSSVLPMGRHVSRVCRSYEQYLGLAFTVAVPWLCNITLVACRDKGMVARGSGARLAPGLGRGGSVLGNLLSKSDVVERALGLPFSCLQYVKNGFRLVG